MSRKQEIDRLVGSNIKRERNKAGYTQEAFSEMIGIGTKSLSAIERGTVGISLSTLLKICDVLSISSNALLSESTHENNVQAIAESLSKLTPEQFSIANDILRGVLSAFALESPVTQSGE